MPMIDSDHLKSELDAVKRARNALVSHQTMATISDRTWHEAEAKRLLDDYVEATHALAWQVQQQVEQAGG
ncbi:MAG: hypothetical protein ACRES5_29660 [Pseudomonas sp.]